MSTPESGGPFESVPIGSSTDKSIRKPNLQHQTDPENKLSSEPQTDEQYLEQEQPEKAANGPAAETTTSALKGEVAVAAVPVDPSDTAVAVTPTSAKMPKGRSQTAAAPSTTPSTQSQPDYFSDGWKLGNDFFHAHSYQDRIHMLDENWGKPSRRAFHNFFYPPTNASSSNDDSTQENTSSQEEAHTPTHHANRKTSGGSDNSPPSRFPTRSPSPSPRSPNVTNPYQLELQEEEERILVEKFWKWYDDIVILSIFGQLGIVFRIVAATWFSLFDGVFNENSALSTNLPLNCLSCFIMGMLCSGEDLLTILYTRIHRPGAKAGAEDAEEDEFLVSRRRREDEMREVQLQALQRRIRASPCLVLFPVKREDVDIVEHLYLGSDSERQRRQSQLYGQDEEEVVVSQPHGRVQQHQQQQGQDSTEGSPPQRTYTNDQQHRRLSSRRDERLTNNRASRRPQTITTAHDHDEDEEQVASQNQLTLERPGSVTVVAATAPPTNALTNAAHGAEEMLHEEWAKVTRLAQVNIADGWDVGTTAQAMSEDLLLGLRVGFCGCLSTFSSWNASMVNLLRKGKLGQCTVGYIIGIQLPVVAYRFGQHVAVYLFVWKCRREVRKDEQRDGYGLQVNMEEEHDWEEDDLVGAAASPRSVQSGDSSISGRIVQGEEVTERETPSIRAILTAVFVLFLVMQVTSLSLYNKPSEQQIAISLLFSPFGVLARWGLSKRFNKDFPMGTLLCNMLGCALSGSLGSLLAGNPGPEESIVLVSIISGFAGSLSSLAAFVVEVLEGIDPLIFKFSGIRYAVLTIMGGILVGFVSRASQAWADEL